MIWRNYYLSYTLFMLIKKEEYRELRSEYKQWNVWQSWEWWEYQSCQHKKVFSVSWDQYLALIIKQDLPFGQNYLEIQRGPLWNLTHEFYKDIQDLASSESSAFVRIIPYEDMYVDHKHYKADNQKFPTSTLIIDLEQDLEDVLKWMKQKWRYNIRLAQKKWVEVKCIEDNKVASELFSSLLVDTTQRDWFSWHSVDVYLSFLNSLWDSAKVYVAYYDDIAIAAWIFTFFEDAAIYYYWASANKYRNLMAPYLVQWEAINYAKSIWCKTYDFLGIADDLEDKKDSLYWVSQFKVKFWGNVVTYPKAVDIPINKFKYFIFRMTNFFR